MERGKFAILIVGLIASVLLAALGVGILNIATQGANAMGGQIQEHQILIGEMGGMIIGRATSPRPSDWTILLSVVGSVAIGLGMLYLGLTIQSLLEWIQKRRKIQSTADFHS
jgi:hypothetical protein